jgi:hypothetical protein
MTQKELIFKHLMKYGSLTALQCFNRYRCIRLSAHIHTLKQEGVPIETQWESDKKTKKQWVRYSIQNH